MIKLGKIFVKYNNIFAKDGRIYIDKFCSAPPDVRTKVINVLVRLDKERTMVEANEK